MKTDKVKYILEACEKFRVTNVFGHKFKFNKNNDDNVYFFDNHFELHVNRGYDYDDDFYHLEYSEVKSIEVFE